MAAVNFANQTALVAYDPAIAKPADLQRAVQSIGYNLVIDVDDLQTVLDDAQRLAFRASGTSAARHTASRQCFNIFTVGF